MTNHYKEKQLLRKIASLLLHLPLFNPHYDSLCVAFWKQLNRVRNLEEGIDDGTSD